MNKPNIGQLVQSAKTYVSKRSPEILTGIGITGMIATTVLAVRDTPKALKLIEEATEERGAPLTPKEKVKVCWKCYIPATATGVFSIACLIGANSVHSKRNAALATAYKLSETAYSEYRNKVAETFGEKKEQTVRDNLAKERIEKNPVSRNEVFITDKSNTLCFDYISKRYFRADIDRIRKVEIKLNAQMINDICGYVSLNDFYDELGLGHVEYGDTIGWNTSNMIELDIGSYLSEDDTPCIMVSHYNEPKYGFDK